MDQLKAILYDISLEFREPCIPHLERWIKKYPEYKKEIREFYIDLICDYYYDQTGEELESNESEPSEGVLKAIQRFYDKERNMERPCCRGCVYYDANAEIQISLGTPNYYTTSQPQFTVVKGVCKFSNVSTPHKEPIDYCGQHPAFPEYIKRYYGRA